MNPSQPNASCLYPLTLFRKQDGAALPHYTLIDGAQMPEPYRKLLVHNGDMTSRLEAFYGGAIVLECLRCDPGADAYRREVVLHVGAGGLAVEYGAIEIRLDAFDASLRAQIIAAELPLGGLLNRHGIKYHSAPLAFLRLEPDPVLSGHFGVGASEVFYGRCNVLRDERNAELARIVEVLRP